MVTTELYVPFQRTDVIRLIGLGPSCGFDTVSFSTWTVPRWPNGPAENGELLQETRSAIYSLHRLPTAAQRIDV
jgi:hypothetical protein